MIYANMEYKLTTSSKFKRYQSSDFMTRKVECPPFLLYTTDKSKSGESGSKYANVNL